MASLRTIRPFVSMVSAFPVIIMRIARRALQTFIGSYVWLSTKTRDCSITLYAPLKTSGRRDTKPLFAHPFMSTSPVLVNEQSFFSDIAKPTSQIYNGRSSPNGEETPHEFISPKRKTPLSPRSGRGRIILLTLGALAIACGLGIGALGTQC